MRDRSAHEQAEYDRVRYEDTDVLRNKLDIRDAQLLEAAERYFVAERSRHEPPEAAKAMSTAGLEALHGHLFQDIYDWAGEIRTYTSGRGPTPFAPPEQIEPWLDKQFAALASENHLRGLSPDRFAVRAAVYVNEINAAHPFIEGNGRTQRAWLRELAGQAGHQITLKSEDKDRWYEASRIGFEQANHQAMADLIGQRIERAQERNREEGERSFKRRPTPVRGRER